MPFFLFRYDDDREPSDFPAEPFFREPFGTVYTPSSNPILHADNGRVYMGGYESAVTAGHLLVQDIPGLRSIINGIGAPRSIISWNGDLWWLSWTGAAAAELYSYDGSALSNPTTFATNALGKIIPFGDKIIAAFNSNGVIERYSLDGTLETLTVANNFKVDANASLPQLAEYKGKVYALGTDSTGTAIYSVNDAGTVAAEKQSLSGTPYSLVKFNGYLYYLYGTKLGKYDGTTFTDEEATGLTGERLTPYKGALLILDSAGVARSDGTDTTTFANTASTDSSDAHPAFAPGEVFFMVS